MTPEPVLERRQITPDGLFWDGVNACLWWSDIPARRILRWCPATDGLLEIDCPGRVGSLARRRSGGLVLAMEHAFATWSEEDGFSILSEPEAGLPQNRFNDGRCDRQGRFLAGSLNIDRSGLTGQLWRLDPDGRTTRITGDVGAANGLAFSPDGRTLYWADTRARTVFAFDYDRDDGLVSNRRVWIGPEAGPGFPDGAAVDADGCYWSARWGGGCVLRVAPDGRIDHQISLPVQRVSMVAFGGSDLRTMFITTATEGATDAELAAEPLAGSVFAVDTGVTGLAEPEFAA